MVETIKVDKSKCENSTNARQINTKYKLTAAKRILGILSISCDFTHR